MDSTLGRKRKAEEHLLALIHGFDPKTHTRMELPGVLEDPEIMRSLLLALEAIRSQGLPQEKDGEAPDRAGRPWTKEEDSVLISAFRGGDSLAELMARHGRGEGGILSRLVRLQLARNKYEARAAIGTSVHGGGDKMRRASN